jgi:hypothetical protein
MFVVKDDELWFRVELQCMVSLSSGENCGLAKESQSDPNLFQLTLVARAKSHNRLLASYMSMLM